jgi:hypothetical protein
VKTLVVGVRVHDRPSGGQELRSDEQREESTKSKGADDADEVEDADPLVIERQKPGCDALVVSQVVVVTGVGSGLNDVGGSGSHSGSPYF